MLRTHPYVSIGEKNMNKEQEKKQRFLIKTVLDYLVANEKKIIEDYKKWAKEHE